MGTGRTGPTGCGIESANRVLKRWASRYLRPELLRGDGWPQRALLLCDFNWDSERL